MDATGRWEVDVAGPLGRFRVDVRIDEDGGIAASVSGQPIEVVGVRLTPEGDGRRARWTQQLTVPVRLRVAVDALLIGDTLTGTAKAGPLFRATLQGRRVA